jgi:serine/threonine-protein kinase
MRPAARPLDSILAAAVEIRSEAQRRHYVAQACAGDAELKRRVEELIENHFRAGSFLEPPANLVATVEESLRECPGTLIGPYKLLEQIGEGGFGTVFLAEQTRPVRRRVALKILKPGMHSREVIARFEAERQALALMDHPHIATVLDGGETASGRPYFVMELVKGIRITDFCDQSHLSVRERLELFVSVCQAVQHAHQKGVIHRDLKPSNVLVTRHDDQAVVKVIDFGIAKAVSQPLTEKTLHTGLGEVVGTPLYMSPEQAQLSGLDVDTRSDIYSLGVLLYELLTGTTPLEKERLKAVGFDELWRIIREEEPPRPSTRISTLGQAATTVSTNRKSDPKQLSRLFRGELDWIVMRALEKDRNRRYETASAFAADVQCYLAHESVLACPPSAWYRFRKFARRNKTGLAVAGLILVFIAVLAGGGGWVLRDRAAREQRLTAQVELILDDVDLLEREQKWPEALVAAKRAEAALAGGEAGDAIRLRVADAHRDVAFVAWLDRIREHRATYVEGAFNHRGAVRDYAAAFRDYGVDVESLPAEEAVARLRSKPALAVRVAAALEDWVSSRRILREGEAAWKPLIAVARAIDPDPLRNRLRAAVGQPETPQLQAELRRLAQSIDVKTVTPATLAALSRSLKLAHLPDAAVQLLRKGQYAHPADFWLNAELLATFISNRNDYAEAARYGSAAVAARPDSAAAHNNLGSVLRLQGKLDEAEAEYRKAIDLDPKHAAAHYNLGHALCKQGKLDQAITECRKAIDLDPKDADAHCILGNVRSAQGKLDEAVAEYHKAIALDPNNAWAHCALGSTLSDQRKLDDAIAYLKKAIALDPKLAAPHYNLGNALGKQGKLDQAITECRKAIDLDPKDADAHCILGNVRWAQGKLDEAITEYRKAIDLDPKLAQAHWNLGDGLNAKGLFDEAIAEYRHALRIKKDFAAAHNGLGVALRNKGLVDEAIAEYRQALRITKDYAEAHCNLGNALMAKGKLDEAFAYSKKAVVLAPNNPLAHDGLGAVLLNQQDYDGAIGEFEKAIALDPKQGSTYFNLGLALSNKGNLDRTAAAYRKAIELDNTLAPAHNFLGACLYHQKKLGEAIACYKKAIELDPKLARAHSNLGAARFDQNKVDEAIACYRKAIEVDPKFAPAHENLGNALAKQKKLDEAIACYHKAIKLDPKSVGAHNNLAWLLATCSDAKWRDPGKAVELAKKAVQLATNDGNSWGTLGTAHYRAGDWKPAVEALQKSMQHRIGGDAGDWFFLAMAQWKLGRHKEAREWFEKAVQWTEKNQLDNEELRRFRAEAEELLGVKKKR